MDGKEHEEIIVAQGGYKGPFIALKAHRDGLSVAPRAQSPAPRLDRFRVVLEPQKRASFSASGLYTDIVVGIGPVEAHKGRQGVRGWWLHGSSPNVWYSGAKGQAGLRSAQAL
jgi:hypothetical protein